MRKEPTVPQVHAVILRLARSRKGLTLLASMMLLIIMSMMGVIAVNMAVQETRIAQNYESSTVNLTWAEAGVEAARQVIVNSDDPDMVGYDCQSDQTTHWYPDSVRAKVMYCVELLLTEMQSESSARGSGQDAARGYKTYYYKVDAFVVRTADNGQRVTLRQIQTVEQQERFSL